MGDLFRNGGWGMYPIVLFGVAAVVTAGYFAARGDGATRGFLALITKAIAAATVAAFASDLIAVSVYVDRAHPTGDRLAAVLVQGLGESLSPVVFGSAFLAVAYLLTALGQRRYDAQNG